MVRERIDQRRLITLKRLQTVSLVAAMLLWCVTVSGLDRGVPDTLVGDARALIAAGQPDKAHSLLAPYADQLAGDVSFDYALALALLDSGEALSATVVFERLLLVAPEFHGARIDLGRAYVALGRLDDARREFQKALDAGPPQKAAALIERYLTELDETQAARQSSRFVLVGTRAGHDSNVNSATELTEFLGFGLNEFSRRQASGFGEVSMVAGGHIELAPRLTLSGVGQAQGRWHRTASFADSQVFTLTTRLDHQRGRHHPSVAVDAFTLVLDGEQNSSALAVRGDWQLELSRSLSLGPTVRVGRVRFTDDLAVKNVNQWSVGLGL
ncbi:MAG: tetratricopeptide repeat protein, partial [Pseudomonadota bacterium]